MKSIMKSMRNFCTAQGGVNGQERECLKLVRGLTASLLWAPLVADKTVLNYCKSVLDSILD